jgi:hypothetical protein
MSDSIKDVLAWTCTAATIFFAIPAVLLDSRTSGFVDFFKFWAVTIAIFVVCFAFIWSFDRVLS